MHLHPGRHPRRAHGGDLRQETAGPDEGTTAYTLAAIKDWTFLLGPGFVVGIGNGLTLGYLMRIAVMFGADEPSGTLQGLATIPEFLWELFLGVYGTIVGFGRRRSSPRGHGASTCHPGPHPAALRRS
jgi:hypothetical protein